MKNDIKFTHYCRRELYSLMYQAEHEKNAFVCYIRGGLCKTSEDFLREVSSAMRFPYYFGWNWNALDECITDLEWLSFSTLFIVIDQFDLMFKDEAPRDEYHEFLIDFLNSVFKYWKSQNIPIEIYLNTD